MDCITHLESFTVTTKADHSFNMPGYERIYFQNIFPVIVISAVFLRTDQRKDLSKYGWQFVLNDNAAVSSLNNNSPWQKIYFRSKKNTDRIMIY